MSVTFHIAAEPTGLFTAYCYETKTFLGPVEGYESGIVPIMQAHKNVCVECDAYGLHSSPVMDIDVDATSLNLSNMNARLMLTVLSVDGGDEDLCGSMSGEDFLGRVLLALATERDDTGVKAAVIGGRELGQSGATMIDCGLPAGYYADRLNSLHALALEAVRLGRKVVWS